MLIGEVVKKTGLSRDTIRFYEKKNLITVGRTDSEWNNYKKYSEEVIGDLILIKKAKSFGFSLNEIKELLELYRSNEASCDVLRFHLENKLKSIDEKINSLQQMRNSLVDKFNIASKSCNIESTDNCKIIVTKA